MKQFKMILGHETETSNQFDPFQLFSLLKRYCNDHLALLNLSETIIYGYGFKKPTLIRSNTQGYVSFVEDIDSREASFFFDRCSEKQNSCNSPIAVILKHGKPPNRAKPELQGIKNAQHGMTVWNKRLCDNKHFIIMKYGSVANCTVEYTASKKHKISIHSSPGKRVKTSTEIQDAIAALRHVYEYTNTDTSLKVTVD